MPRIKMLFKMNLSIDYIRFNGKNLRKVLAFAQEHKLLGDSLGDSYEERPKDIPNISLIELSDWWVKDSQKNNNGHTIYNCPDWNKDELAKVYLKSGYSGFSSSVRLFVGTTIINFGNRWFTLELKANEGKSKIVKEIYEYIERELSE